MATKSTSQNNGQDMSVNELARIVAQGFESMEQRFDAMDQRLTSIESRLDKVEARMDRLEARMDHLEDRMDHLEVKMDHLEDTVSGIRRDLEAARSEVTPKSEIDDLSGRVKYLEVKLGIESGKD